MISSRKINRDRRSDTRIKIEKEVKIFFQSEGGEKSLIAALEEINELGLSFSLSPPTELPQRIKVELPPILNGEKVTLPSIVRWHTENQSNVRFGVSFRRLNFGQTKHLDYFLRDVRDVELKRSNRRRQDRRIEVRELRRLAETNTHIVGQLRKQLRHRVAVTGMGIISPMGVGHQVLWNKLCEGYSAIDLFNVTNLNGEIIQVLAAKVDGFNPFEYLEPKKVRSLQRSSQFACAAATLALQDAGIKMQSKLNPGFGVYVGTIIGGMEKIFAQSMVCVREGPQAMDPFIGFSGSWDEAASAIAMNARINGPSQTICTGCASSTDAIGTGFRAIQRGDLDFALAGGTDAPLSPQIISSFKNLGLLSNDLKNPKSSMRPFDLNRDGFVIGEGAAFLMLENLEKATLRGANIYAELIGYGNSCDAYSPTSRDPLGNGLAVAISNALADAGVMPSEIDYVNLHGTGTNDGDRSEAYAVRKVFGQHVQQLSFGFIKPMIGHMQGAAGSAEASVTIMALNNGQPPPLLNIRDIDPECALNFSKGKRQNSAMKTAISMNSGFGGKNAVLVFKKTG